MAAEQAVAEKVYLPKFKWAQDFDILFIAIELTDVDPNKMEVKIERETLFFKAASHDKLYELSFNFRFPVNPKTAKFSVKRFVEFILEKETSEAFWPHLLSKEDKKKYKGQCHIDWDKFKDEDDLEEDGGGIGDNMDMSGFQGMPGGMGGMGGMPGMGGMGGMPGMGGMGGMPGMGGMGGMPGMGGAGGMGGMDMEALKKLAAFGKDKNAGGDDDSGDDDDDDDDSDDAPIPDLENENKDAENNNTDKTANNDDDDNTAAATTDDNTTDAAAAATTDNSEENKDNTATATDTTKAADAAAATTNETGDDMVEID